MGKRLAISLLAVFMLGACYSSGPSDVQLCVMMKDAADANDIELFLRDARLTINEGDSDTLVQHAQGVVAAYEARNEEQFVSNLSALGTECRGLMQSNAV